MNTDPLTELPIGFGMALLRNQRAAQCFKALSREEQQQILAQLHSVSSKQEMAAFIDHLSDKNFHFKA